MPETIHIWVEVGILVLAFIMTTILGLFFKKIMRIDVHETKIALHKQKLDFHAQEISRMRSKLETHVGLTPLPRRVNRIKDEDE